MTTSIEKQKKIDKVLLEFDKSDVSTPDDISKLMSSYLSKKGNLLEPAVGTGQLLKFVELDKYDSIDIFDIKSNYLEVCPDNNNITKYNKDFLKECINKKYKNIILNPPYIKIQDLSNDYRDFIKTQWSILINGSLDIYYAFMLKCIELLDNKGIMVCIIPNSYLYNKGSYDLRKYLIENKLIERIIDYRSEKVFKNVGAYCCITVITKKRKTNLIYNDTTIKYKSICEKMYNIFIEKGTVGTKKLGDICNIKNGIATLRDKIYIHKERKYEEPCWQIITNGINDSWCIFPYDKNGKVLEEDYFKTHNPKTYKYLCEHKDELAKRDKGNKTYPKWYSYGRTQALIKPVKDNIIYMPALCDRNNIRYKIDSSKIHMSSLSIELKTDDYTLEYIVELIEKNSDFIVKNSLNRAGGWIIISSRILKNIQIL